MSLALVGNTGFPHLILVHLQGNSSPSPAAESDERHLFPGAENPLVYGRHHNIQFQCSFDMTYYPFDVQRCHMIFLRNPGVGKFLLRWAKQRNGACVDVETVLFFFIRAGLMLRNPWPTWGRGSSCSITSTTGTLCPWPVRSTALVRNNWMDKRQEY